MRFIIVTCAVASLITLTGCASDKGSGDASSEDTTGTSTQAPPPNNPGNPGVPGIPGGGGTGTPNPGKSFFSVWNNNFYKYDFRAALLPGSSVAPVQFFNFTCGCTITLGGAQDRGTIVVSNCLDVDRSPQCAAHTFNGTFFRLPDGALKLCNTVGQCSDYF